MSASALAHQLDKERRMVEAAEMYERAIGEESPVLDVYLDAAVLYMSAADFGLASFLRLPRDFEAAASERAEQALRAARVRFGDVPDIEFWELYIAWATLGGSFPAQTAFSLQRAGSRDVYLYLAQLKPIAPQFLEACFELRRSVAQELTERERYIKSVLDSALRGYRNDSPC